MLLSDLHKVIQTAMGWTNSHLHQFVKGQVILEPMPEDDFMEMLGTNYAGYTIDRLLKKKNDKIRYEYDFGDGWDHAITLEKIHEDFGDELPICTDGAMNCPPEDVGGIGGFQHFKKAIKPEFDSKISNKYIGVSKRAFVKISHSQYRHAGPRSAHLLNAKRYLLPL